MSAGGACAPSPGERYRRHVVLTEVGARGQEAIRRSAVRVVGDGPAAEEAAFYLVAAGVGRVMIDTGLMARHGERLAELNPEVLLDVGSMDESWVLGALEVRPLEDGGRRRAEGARLALVAIMRASGVARFETWTERGLGDADG